jgi:hypothetical protein
MHAVKFVSRAMEAIFARSVRKFAYKLKFEVFKTISIDNRRLFRIEKNHFKCILSIFDIGLPLFPRRLAGLSGNRHFGTSSSGCDVPTALCCNVYSVRQVPLQKNGISANTRIYVYSGLSSDGLMR